MSKPAALRAVMLVGVMTFAAWTLGVPRGDAAAGAELGRAEGREASEDGTPAWRFGVAARGELGQPWHLDAVLYAGALGPGPYAVRLTPEAGAGTTAAAVQVLVPGPDGRAEASFEVPAAQGGTRHLVTLEGPTGLLQAERAVVREVAGRWEAKVWPVRVAGGVADTYAALPREVRTGDGRVAMVEVDPGAPDPLRAVRPGADAGAAVAATLTGSIKYHNPYNVASLSPCRQCKVDLWDYDYPGNYQFLGTVMTNYASGSFSYGIVNSDEDGTGVDIDVDVFEDSSYGRAGTGAGSIFAYRTEEAPVSCPAGATTCSVGTMTLFEGDEWNKRHMLYENLVKSFYAAAYRSGGPAYNPGVVRVKFPVDGYGTDTATSAYFAYPGDREIHIGSQRYGRDTVTHEHGHYIMYKAYGLQMPGTGADTTQGAWNEGWAKFWSLYVKGSSIYVWDWDNFRQLNFETYNVATRTGDTKHERVAATLWDLRDGVNDGLDTYGYSMASLWAAFVWDTPMELDLYAYYQDWVASGRSATAFKQVACQNTINYGNYAHCP